MFSFLKGLLKPRLRLEHPYFGSLLLWEFKDRTKNYWEGQGNFSPQLENLTVIINAGAAGPTEAQVQFAKHLFANLDQLAADKLCPALTAEFPDIYKSPLTAAGFWQIFTCIGVTIPEDGDENGEWEIDFTRHDIGDYLSVNFLNGGVNYVTRDS